MNSPLFMDLTGEQFGRLHVVERAENDRSGNAKWLCRCECGNYKIILGKALRTGSTRSCGCYLAEQSKKRMKILATKHGLSKAKLYSVWGTIVDRCTNDKCKGYHNYGGRGISICDEWRHDVKAFYDYVSSLPHFGEPGRSIDRIDNNGNYEPGNIRWATFKEQANNTRPKKNTVWVVFNGETMSLADMARKYGINYATVRRRYAKGMPIEKILFQGNLREGGKANGITGAADTEDRTDPVQL